MYQAKISNIIIRLKKVRNNNPEITIQKISDQTGVSMSTVTRIFADGSENQSFRYESLKPIALMLLGSDGLDEDMHTEEVEMRVSQIKEKYEGRLEKEQAQHQRRVDFLMHQIELKDERITLLLNEVKDRGEQFSKLHQQYLELTNQILKNKREVDL